MKNLVQFAAILFLAGLTAHGQTIIADDYNVTGSGTGFALGSGVNSGINPPTTRLTGSMAANMRYFRTATGRAETDYSIGANALQVAGGANSGRFTLSNDGTTAFDFGPALGTSLATAVNPVVYDITISMANNSASGNQYRFSFALATVENNANFWDFGIQLYRSTTTSARYAIGRRIDVVSYTTATDSSGTTGDLNDPYITTTGANTFGSQIDFLIRVTDAGAETSTFNSRVQVSRNGGSTWLYDTDSDAALPDGFRFDTASRYFSWDIAGGAVATYDNFSVTIVPEPSVAALGLLAAAALIVRRRR